MSFRPPRTEASDPILGQNVGLEIKGEQIGVIETAAEFIELRSSDVLEEYTRAAHEEAPLTVWKQVIEEFPEYRFWVAHNKTVPVEILRVLSADPDRKVRDMVARKRKLPEELQLILARDSDDGVRMALACNRKATEATLGILASDSCEDVREKAASRLTEGMTCLH
jgi:hypothetical protein